MAGTKVRGITIELSADASGISKELQNVNKSISSTGRELKDIEKLLKLDPSNVQLLAQKQEALARQISNTKDKVDLLKKAEEDLKAQMVDGGTEEQKKQLAALQREIISTERNLDSYESQLDQTGKETKELAREEKQAAKATDEMSGGFSVLKGAMASLVADGIRKAVDGFKDLMTAGPAFADEILTMSSQTGVATEQLQELSYMSGLVDVDVNTVAGSLKKLTKSMSSAKDGSGAAADAFETLGISVTDAQGNLRDNEDVFYDAIDALGKIQNETERDAIAMQIFGKSATDLNPMIEAGSDALKGFADEAHEMGYVLDEDALEALGRVQDEFDRFSKQMEGVKNQIASGVAPAIERGMKKLRDVVQKINWQQIGKKIGDVFEKLIDAFEWIVDHGALIKSLLTGIVSAMAAQKVMQFVSGIASMTSALKTATTAQEGLNAAANANPYILIATAIIGVTTALVSYGKHLNEASYEASLHVQRTNELIERGSALVESVNASAEAYQELREARDASVAAGTAEMAHVQELAAELTTLADESGRVKKNDQARAEFILGELNGALGTEYTMTGNVIDQYAKLTGQIDELIEKKKAEIILSAQEDAYREAITHRDEAEQQLIETVKEQAATQAELTRQEERRAELEKIIASSGQYNEAAVTELANLSTAHTELLGHMEELNAAYDTQADIVNKYAYDVTAYEDNMTKALKGNYDDIEYSSYEVTKAMGKHIDDYAGRVKKDTEDAIGDFSQMSGKMEAAAREIGGGVAKGIEAGAGPAYTAMSTFGNNLLTKFKKTMEIQSPSKKMQENAKYMVDGVVTGIKLNENKAVNAMGEMANKMVDAFRPNLRGVAFSGSEFNSLNLARLMAYSNVPSNSFTQNIYAPQQPSRIELYRQTRNLLAAAGRL